MDQSRTLDHPQMLRDDVAASSANRPGATRPDPHRSKMRLIDWIWNVRGSVPLAPGQSSDEAFGRLDPLFDQPGTTYERTGDALSFKKKDQAAQDRMSIFDVGVLQVEQGAGGPVLRYRLFSRALLFCFLAPFLFVAFGQLIVGVGILTGPSTEAAEKDKKDEKKDVVRKLNPIDEFLGAPAPEKPKKDDTSEDKDDKHSPTAAYVFAALFAALYVAGRLLEDKLIRSLFRRSLHEG